MVNVTCDVVSRQRRSYLYRILQQWIRFADENKIMWWISSGTLLGAVRDGNMIPYDLDIDISVPAFEESKLRQLSTTRGRIKNGQFNLAVRPGPHCIESEGIRQNCYGQSVRSEIDCCAACEPFARAFYEVGWTYMDIYLFRFEMRFDNEQRPIEFTYFDESFNEFIGDIYGLFPLKACKFLGLHVPCPRDPATILGPQYGKEFMKPRKLCNLTGRSWVKSS
ncbi:unnamed protein product [Calicophoron daubneyi]|uniref:LicD/FKTN/FKRP nucleotidyltransferase domain-containing protein n=2 Tax=Calicophoron daubneyi TaxID=300641 RepID=A0AAV2SZ59_CALDB